MGQGATGIVYRARDASGRVVAVKVLNAALAADDRFRRRFLREATLAAQLEHPNVVPIVATGEDAGVLYIAMAYVDGRRPAHADPRRRAARAATDGRAADRDRRRPGRRPRRRADPPRRDAGEHPARHRGRARAGLPRRLRPRAARDDADQPHRRAVVRRHDRLHRARADPRRPARRPRPTSTRWRACCTSASAASSRLRATPTSPPSSPISTSARRRSRRWHPTCRRPWTASSRAASPRIPRPGTPTARRCSPQPALRWTARAAVAADAASPRSRETGAVLIAAAVAGLAIATDAADSPPAAPASAAAAKPPALPLDADAIAVVDAKGLARDRADPAAGRRRSRDERRLAAGRCSTRNRSWCSWMRAPARQAPRSSCRSRPAGWPLRQPTSG